MTPSKTPFAGLEVLSGAQDPLSSDGYAFTRVNPVVTDRLLKVGAVTHRHDGHAALADPTLAATLAADSAGGAIPSGLSIYVAYTLFDADGGETLPSTPQRVNMPAGFTAPTTPPTVTNTPGAGLMNGTYTYGVTITDGSGGETRMGPIAAIVGSGTFHIAGLSALVAAAVPSGASGAGWRLWRRQNGGQLYLVGTGLAADDTFDDAGVPGDCTIAPPTFDTTAATNMLKVTVPSGQPAGTTQFAIYVSMSATTFQSPALLGIYPASDLDVEKDYPTLLVAQGAPPPVSRSFAGASRINADTDLDDLHWRAPVATIADLPSTGNSDGDTRRSLDDRAAHVWNEGAGEWQPDGGGGGGGVTVKRALITGAAIVNGDATAWSARTTVVDEIGCSDGVLNGNPVLLLPQAKAYLITAAFDNFDANTAVTPHAPVAGQDLPLVAASVVGMYYAAGALQATRSGGGSLAPFVSGGFIAMQGMPSPLSGALSLLPEALLTPANVGDLAAELGTDSWAMLPVPEFVLDYLDLTYATTDPLVNVTLAASLTLTIVALV